MVNPLRVRIAVYDDAQPVLDALHAMRRDVGSISATSLGIEGLPLDARFLCVALTSASEAVRLGAQLRDELALLPEAVKWEALSMTNRVMLWPLPLDTVLLVFVDIPAIEVPL